MAEIYRDTTDAVATLTVGLGTSVRFYRDDIETTATLLTPNTVAVPYSLTRLDGTFHTSWAYTVGGVPYTRQDENTVVTPYFSKAELIEHDVDMTSLTDAQVIKLERLVRRIINAHVGQDFGYSEGALVVYGNGGSLLNTEKRVLSVTSVAQASDPTAVYAIAFRPIHQGFSIEAIEYSSSDNIKVPAWEEATFGNFLPIGARYENNVAYLLKGKFGYESVPYDVNLAALALAEEFSCDENLWRDRYIKSISGDGFDVEFRSEAFMGTGSVVADQLLGKYVVNKLAII